MKTERNNQVLLQNFVDYQRFIYIVNNAREKHFQPKIIKYNKKKQKGSCWITFGILE